MYVWLLQISIGNTLEIVDRFSRRPLDGSIYRDDGRSLEFVIRDYSRAVRGSGYYWSLPKHFLGNKVHIVCDFLKSLYFYFASHVLVFRKYIDLNVYSHLLCYI